MVAITELQLMENHYLAVEKKTEKKKEVLKLRKRSSNSPKIENNKFGFPLCIGDKVRTITKGRYHESNSNVLNIVLDTVTIEYSSGSETWRKNHNVVK